MLFEIVSTIEGIETIARGSGIRELKRLKRIYGEGRWRKRKGVAEIMFQDGSVHTAELHWYEASGIGKQEYKVKRLF